MMDHTGVENTVARRLGLAVLGLGLVSNNIPMVCQDNWSGKKNVLSLYICFLQNWTRRVQTGMKFKFLIEYTILLVFMLFDFEQGS
jgi:hypothetical protein